MQHTPQPTTRSRSFRRKRDRPLALTMLAGTLAWFALSGCDGPPPNATGANPPPSVDKSLVRLTTEEIKSAGIIVQPVTRSEFRTIRDFPGTVEPNEHALAEITTLVRGRVIDVYADPVCPYAWIVSRWLEEVAPSRPVELRHHVMSLRILNEGHHQGTAYQANVTRTAGPSRVFTAAAVHVGEGILRDLYTAFGTRWFARWRRPDPDELRDTMEAAGYLRAALKQDASNPVLTERLFQLELANGNIAEAEDIFTERLIAVVKIGTSNVIPRANILQKQLKTHLLLSCFF